MMHKARLQLGLLLLAACPVLAQPGPDAPASAEGLRKVEQAIERSAFEQRRLAFEIDNLSAEQQKLRASLVEVAARVRGAEERFASAETRHADVSAREAALRRSLVAREKVTAEVLAAMQRIGRKPPPAVLVSPEDVLGAMRAAILLGVVLPDLRDEAMVLIADLRTLVDLRKEAADLRDSMARARDAILADRARLTGLIAARQGDIGQNRERIEAEKTRIATLSREAKSLRDLISRNENELIGPERAVEIARRVPLSPRASQDVASLGAVPPRDPVRLSPRVAFADLKGKLPLPVAGEVVRAFGAPDGLGGTERGVAVQSIADALVSSPADATVSFAGAYRGYGQVIILNPGSGYLIVLGGIGQRLVEPGQTVMAGEPLGQLGVSAAIRAGEGVAQSRPALYVEIRKDGVPFDPQPWWIPLTQKAQP